jgi:regulatory associated protein of mTOR
MRSQQMANPGMEGVHVPYTPLSQCIQLAACRFDEVLPMSPDLPADLFTSCLTTPITMALRWFVISNPLIKNVSLEMTMKVPGRVTDRRTPLGELNWIFTSITDTIAWSVLPTDLFLRLFRNDLMVAALFRNFLLADRIMRNFNCHPVSDPVLPQTNQHPMWEAWDLAADHCLSQLPSLLDSTKTVEYKLSTFFSDQLSAFEVWIKKGGSSTDPPLQLPIVLQVLLSQVHRLRALLLLSKFLDFGEWAVNLALSVGIFPYVLKLLQSPALELRPVLVFIWAKLLAVDPSCRNDLLKDNGYTYFIGILTNTNTSAFLVPNISEHRAMCVFILSVFCRDFPAGQHACLSNDLLPALLPYLTDQDSLLRQWTTVCLSSFWANFADGKWAAINVNAHEQLSACLLDPVPEVRAGALAALGYLLGDLERVEQVLNIEKFITVALLKCLPDPSPLIRKELTCALSKLVQEEEDKFIFIAFEVLDENRKSSGGSELKKFSSTSPYSDNRKGPIQQSLHLSTWKALLTLSADPFYTVAAAAGIVVDRIYQKVIMSHFVDPSLLQWIENTKASLDTAPARSSPEHIIAGRRVSKRASASVSSGIFGMSLETTSQSLKKASSFQFSLRNLMGGVGSNSSISHQPDTGARNSRISTSIIRRPQSMIISGSAGDLSPVPSTDNRVAPLPKPVKLESSLAAPSNFYEWSCEYFTEPQMKIPEIDDPGSLKFSERQWRSQRNHKLDMQAVSSYVSIGN